MPQTSEQAGQIFAQMTPEQVRQYLTQTMVNIGPLQPVDAPMGSADGVRREDMTPTYGNANVQGLQADGQGGYWGPVTPPFDTQQAGGRYGQYFAKFDVQGNMQPDSLQFSPVERDSGWLSNHLPEVVGTIIAVAGGVAAYQLAAGAPTAGGVGAAGGEIVPTVAEAAAGAGGAAAPISQGVGMTSLGTAPTLADIGTAIANGANLDNLGTAALNLIKSGGMPIVNAIKSIVTSQGKNGSIVDQIASGLGITGGNALGGLFTSGAGLAALGSLKNASNTAADQYGGLADSVKGQYQFLGDKAQGMFNGLGAQGQSEYNALGMRVGETYNNLADTYQQGYALLGDKVGTTYNNLATNTEGQYTNLANKATEQVGKFTPYNITTNVGTTNDKGTFTPTAGAQGISDSATKAAQSSFDAGNAIDVNNLTKQRYDQMQSIFAPGDAESLSRIQATEQARGRTGIQSLNQANEFGGVGSNPAMVAYYKAQQDRNLKAQATAADQALAQRGGLLSQGSGAAAVPLNIANQGLQQLSTGAQIGNTAFQNNMAGTQLGTGIEKSGLDRGYNTRMRGVSDVTGLYQRGLDRGLDTRIRGADTVTGMFDKGIGYNLGQRAQGINNNLDLSARGISASTPLYAQQIGQRYQGNLAATNALFGVLGQLARATGKAAPANTGNATQMAADAIKLLTNIGMTEAEASAEIDRQLSAGEFSYGQDYSSSEDFINNFNSIFEG